MKIRLGILLILFSLILTGCSANTPPWTDVGMKQVLEKNNGEILLNGISNNGRMYAMKDPLGAAVRVYDLVSGNLLYTFESNGRYGNYYIGSELEWSAEDDMLFVEAQDERGRIKDNRVVILHLKEKGAIVPYTFYEKEMIEARWNPEEKKVLISTDDEKLILNSRAEIIERVPQSPKGYFNLWSGGKLYYADHTPENEKAKARTILYISETGMLKHLHQVAELPGTYSVVDVSKDNKRLLLRNQGLATDKIKYYLIFNSETSEIEKEPETEGWPLPNQTLSKGFMVRNSRTDELAVFSWGKNDFEKLLVIQGHVRYMEKLHGFVALDIEDGSRPRFIDYRDLPR